MKSTLLLSFLYISGLCSAQIQETVHFTRLLEEFDARLTFTEQPYIHASQAINSEQEDLYLRSDDGDIEYHFFFYPLEKIPGSLPHIYASNRLIDLASNEKEQWISHYLVTEDEALEKFGATWANESAFKPKTSFSPFSRCRQYALYSPDRGMIISYVCYDDTIVDYKTIFSPIVFKKG